MGNGIDLTINCTAGSYLLPKVKNQTSSRGMVATLAHQASSLLGFLETMGVCCSMRPWLCPRQTFRSDVYDQCSRSRNHVTSCDPQLLCCSSSWPGCCLRMRLPTALAAARPAAHLLTACATAPFFTRSRLLGVTEHWSTQIGAEPQLHMRIPRSAALHTIRGCGSHPASRLETHR